MGIYEEYQFRKFVINLVVFDKLGKPTDASVNLFSDF
jgi:hypothetical protein